MGLAVERIVICKMMYSETELTHSNVYVFIHTRCIVCVRRRRACAKRLATKPSLFVDKQSLVNSTRHSQPRAAHSFRGRRARRACVA